MFLRIWTVTHFYCVGFTPACYSTLTKVKVLTFSFEGFNMHSREPAQSALSI